MTSKRNYLLTSKLFRSTRPLLSCHVLACQLMSQGDTTETIKFLGKLDINVTNGQVCDGTISKSTYHEEYYLCGKFHACTIWLILGLCRYTIIVNKV